MGKVIKRLYAERESLWIVDANKGRVDEPKRRRVGLQPNAASCVETVESMKDGRKICCEWNRGGCREPCPNSMLHVCARKLKNGRACGMGNHLPGECENARRAK